MADKQLQFSLLIKAIDAATAPIRAVSQTVQTMMRNTSTAVRASTNDFAAWHKGVERSEKLMQFAGSAQLAGQELREISEMAKSVVEGPIEAWTDFEHAMTRVRIVTGASRDDLGRVVQLAKQVGSTGQQSAAEVAEATAVLASAGMKNIDDLLRVVPAVKNAAIATGESLHDAAHLAIDMWQEFKLRVDEVPAALDAVTKATTSTSLTIADLKENFAYMGAMASMAKMTIPDTIAMLAQLSNLGIRGSMGGTAFREIIQRIGAPERRAQKTLDDLGVRTTDDNHNIRPLMSILGDFYKSTRGLGTEQQTRAYHDVFGERAVEAAEALGRSSASGQFETLRQSINDSQGTSARMATEAMDDQLGATKALTGATDNLRIASGRLLSSTTRPSIEAFTKLVEKLDAAVEAHPRLTQVVLVGVAAFGALTGGLASLVVGIGSTAATLSVLSLTMGGTQTGAQILAAGLTRARTATLLFRGAVADAAIAAAPLAIAVGALALAGFTIYKNWTPIKAFFHDLFTDFGGTVSGLISWIEDLSSTAVNTLLNIFKHPIDSLKQIPEAFRNLWTAMNGGDLGPEMHLNAPSARSRALLGQPRDTVTTEREKVAAARAAIAASDGTVEHRVGGRIDIKLDVDGRPRVTKMTSSGGIDLSVHTGHAMGSP